MNWNAVSKQKRPGMHLLSSLQAVAHGSDSVMYFQWRKAEDPLKNFMVLSLGMMEPQIPGFFKEVALGR